MAKKRPHDWSKEAFLIKAQRYATLMHEQSRESWQFSFWSALCLEMLVRASISAISPALLADGKEWRNIAYALGKEDSGPDSPRKSIPISEILKQAEFFFPDFTKEVKSFCSVHFQRRNSELHTGALPFEDLTAWLPEYYNACGTLFRAMNVSMEQIFGEEVSASASTLIQAFKDDASKVVNKTINHHKKNWDAKNLRQRKNLAKIAETSSLRSSGHRAECPACKSVGLIQGSPTGSEKVVVADGIIRVRQSMIPSHFECKACGLKITGFSKLNACNLGDTFTSTITYEPSEYFEDEFRAAQDENMGMFEDNNEP